MSRDTQAVVDLDAIRSNYQLAQAQSADASVGPSNTIPVIKANAYGHGAIVVAKALEPLAPAFAVAIFEEAVELRNAGVTKPLLILQGINNQQELEYAQQHNIWLMIANSEQANSILKLSDKNLAANKFWIKLDTGMHRLGLQPKEARKVLTDIQQRHCLDRPVVCTHLSCASDPQNSFSKVQIDSFDQFLSTLEEPIQSSIETSIANSAGILGLPHSHRHWNRPGIMLYGLSPFDQPNLNTVSQQQEQQLKAAMSFVSTVSAIRMVKQGKSVGYGANWTAKRDSAIATIAVGYADGYPRHAKNGTPVLVAGQMAKLAGRVSMDMITVDISHCNNDIHIGDPVELWGETISADEVALCSETIGYDLVTGISQRVPLVYREQVI